MKLKEPTKKISKKLELFNPVLYSRQLSFSSFDVLCVENI